MNFKISIVLIGNRAHSLHVALYGGITQQLPTAFSQVLYRVSHELRSLFRESIPYVKIYRYNPKHLCLKLNGYGDNGKRKVFTS